MFTLGPAFRVIAQSAPSSDEFFAFVTALLHFDDTIGTNVYDDASSYNHTVGESGSNIIIADGKFGGRGANFNTGAIQLPASVSDFKTHPFTIEGYFKNASTSTIFTTRGGSLFPSLSLMANTYNGFRGVRLVSSTNGTTLENDISTNPGAHLFETANWTHFAVTGDGATLRAFIEGVKVIETAYTNLSSPGVSFEFFRNSSGSTQFGQLDECRITNGVCRYTANFSVPTSAFFDTGPAFNSNVALLLQMNGASGTSTFVDSSPTRKTVSVEGGGVTMVAAAAKYGISGARFTGNGGRIKIAHNSSLALSTGDFTIAFHVNNTTLDNPQNSYKILITKTVGQGFYPYRISRDTSDRISVTGYNTSNSLVFSMVSSTVSANTWYHVALTRTGNTVRLFLDGILQGSATVTDNLQLNASAPVSIGAFEDGGSNNAFTGDIDNVLILNQSLYSSNFIPPTAPYTNFV